MDRVLAKDLCHSGSLSCVAGIVLCGVGCLSSSWCKAGCHGSEIGNSIDEVGLGLFSVLPV